MSSERITAQARASAATFRRTRRDNATDREEEEGKPKHPNRRRVITSRSITRADTSTRGVAVSPIIRSERLFVSPKETAVAEERAVSAAKNRRGGKKITLSVWYRL